MATTKVMATHMSVGGMRNVLHVDMPREALIKRLADFPSDDGTQDSILGMDFPVLARYKPTEAYRRSRVWIGVDLLKDTMMGHEHEVEVSDTPMGEIGDEGTATTTPPLAITLPDDLEANL